MSKFHIKDRSFIVEEDGSPAYRIWFDDGGEMRCKRIDGKVLPVEQSAVHDPVSLDHLRVEPGDPLPTAEKHNELITLVEDLLNKKK
jgi:hypothetical protein